MLVAPIGLLAQSQQLQFAEKARCANLVKRVVSAVPAPCATYVAPAPPQLSSWPEGDFLLPAAKPPKSHAQPSRCTTTTQEPPISLPNHFFPGALLSFGRRRPLLQPFGASDSFLCAAKLRAALRQRRPAFLSSPLNPPPYRKP